MTEVSRRERWTTVLAGGQGQRLAPLVSALHPDGRPKQFCVLEGGKTMIERTLDRVGYVSPPRRTVVSLGRSHLRWRGPLDRYDGLHLSVQPADAGTGPAVLVATSWIAARSPEAIVVLSPSDHYVSDDCRFMAHVEEAARWVARHPNGIVLLGAEATHPDTGYGWLLPRRPGRAFRGPQPADFVEKPSAPVAAMLLESGALWNTLVAVYTASTMRRLMAALAPQWFHAVEERIGLGPDALEEPYATLPRFDLSRDVLARAQGHVHVLPVQGVLWSDLGTIERVRHTLGHAAPGLEAPAAFAVAP